MQKTTLLEVVKQEVPTLISKGVKIEGIITISGNIRIDGEVQGEIISKGSIMIGEDGKIGGQITAKTITIGGKVEGTIKANEKLVLETTANLKGDIFSKILIIEEGAKFVGNSKMGEGEIIREYKEIDKLIASRN